MKRQRPKFLGWGCCLALVAGIWQGGGAAAAPSRWSVLDSPALSSTPAARPFLLSGARAGNRLVVAGERGILFLSDDNGQTWRQAAVPVGVSITAVRFATPRRGWAVGHFGVVLQTEDGGETWRKQLDGVAAAQLLLEDALRRTGGDRSDDAVRWAERMVKDGPDKPFLDLLILGERGALVVGSYGLAFRTDDAGVRWEPSVAAIADNRHLHLNAVSTMQGNGTVFVVGEQGTVLRSGDAGASFETLNSPYEGSFFSVLATSPKDVLIFGLRGNAFQSSDGGVTWAPLDLKSGATLTSAIALRDGGVLVADQGGQLFRREAGSPRFAPVESPVRLPLAGLVEAANGTVLGVGPAGVLPVYSPLSR